MIYTFFSRFSSTSVSQYKTGVVALFVIAFEKFYLQQNVWFGLYVVGSEKVEAVPLVIYNTCLFLTGRYRK